MCTTGDCYQPKGSKTLVTQVIKKKKFSIAEVAANITLTCFCKWKLKTPVMWFDRKLTMANIY